MTLLKRIEEHLEYHRAIDTHFSDIAFLEKIKEDVIKMKKGLESVQYLIDDSTGVHSLHLNGDHAPWEELLEGGFYEEWLQDFSIAMNEVIYD